MECPTIGFQRYCPDERALCLSWSPLKSNLNNLSHVRCNVAPKTRGAGPNKLMHLQISNEKHLPRTYSAVVGLEEESSLGSPEFQDDEKGDETDSGDVLAKPLSRDELKALLVDTERARLTKKLSEANQHNRFLKRELKGKVDALTHFKTELAVMEHEIQALLTLANEVAKAGIPEGSRKINGKFIHSHLLFRLEAVQKKLQEQIKDVDAVQSKEVSLFWIGMAENVQVMGSFDGWSQGEHLSPEYTGSYTKFSTTLFLQPGRYEIKFLVDGMWRISPNIPSVGEGLMENNLLMVE